MELFNANDNILELKKIRELNSIFLNENYKEDIDKKIFEETNYELYVFQKTVIIINTINLFFKIPNDNLTIFKNILSRLEYLNKKFSTRIKVKELNIEFFNL